MRLTQGILKKPSLPVLVIVLLTAALALLMVLDYFNLESLEHFNKGGFYFDYSWKGRMFHVGVFGCLYSGNCTSRGLKQAGSTESKGKRYLRFSAVILCASIPLIYIVSENFPRAEISW